MWVFKFGGFHGVYGFRSSTAIVAPSAWNLRKVPPPWTCDEWDKHLNVLSKKWEL